MTSATVSRATNFAGNVLLPMSRIQTIKEATQQVITVRGNRVANDGALVRQWGVAGLGLVLKSELDVALDIRTGRLVEILANNAPPPTPLQMLFPPSRAQPARVRSQADQLGSSLRSLAIPNPHHDA